MYFQGKKISTATATATATANKLEFSLNCSFSVAAILDWAAAGWRDGGQDAFDTFCQLKYQGNKVTLPSNLLEEISFDRFAIGVKAIGSNSIALTILSSERDLKPSDWCLFGNMGCDKTDGTCQSSHRSYIKQPLPYIYHRDGTDNPFQVSAIADGWQALELQVGGADDNLEITTPVSSPYRSLTFLTTVHQESYTKVAQAISQSLTDHQNQNLASLYDLNMKVWHQGSEKTINHVYKQGRRVF